MFLRHQTGCVSQTGEAELAAREIAPQLQTLEITGHAGDTGIAGQGTLALAGIHGPGPGCAGCAVTV